jgi:hypothetical protein
MKKTLIQISDYLIVFGIIFLFALFIASSREHNPRPAHFEPDNGLEY